MYYFKHNLAVVVPTKGRKTIVKCLESLKPVNQQGYGAETLVVYDMSGPTPEDYFSLSEILELGDTYSVSIAHYNARYNDWGYPQLAYGYEKIEHAEYIMNIGDDDIMIEGIIPDMVQIINHNGIQPYMFQAELFPSAHRGNTEPVILWNDSDRSLTRGSVTGQNFVVPNIPHLFGRMTDDFEFIRTTIEKWHGLCQWIPLVTTRCF